MSLDVELVGKNGTARKVAVSCHVKEDVHTGLVAYTEPYRDFENQFAPFVNSEYGANMNIDGAFGGTPLGIHDGIDSTLWTGSNIVGGKAVFNNTARPRTGTNSVRIDNPAINDIWQFDKGSDLVVADYVAITIYINIDKDWSTGDSVSLYCWDTSGATIVGALVLLEDYMDEFNFDVWQTISIPFADLGLTTTNFDAIRMEHVGKGGGKSPKFYLDDMQVEQSGTPAIFKTETPIKTKYYIDKLIITVVDALDTTLANSSMPSLSYDKILGLAELTNGILLQRTVKNKITFSAPLRKLGDFMAIGFDINSHICDGTNTLITLGIDFPKPLLTFGGSQSFLSLQVSDDLTGLIHLNAVARGSIEVKQLELHNI